MAFETKSIGDVCITNPETYKVSEKWPYVNYLDTGNLTKGVIDSIQVISIGEKLPSRARRKVKAMDVLYSTVRPNQEHYGFLEEPLENMLVSTGFTVLRAKEGVNPKYVYYLLSQKHVTDLLHAVAENSTSAYPSLKPLDIEKMEFNFPEESIQNLVVKSLSDLDKKIELNRQINQTLEEMAQAIFKSWFVDFDPVKAKVTVLENGGSQDEAELAAMEVISGKTVQELEALQTQHPDQYQQLHHTASLFPNAMQTTELGEIPNGWELQAIGTIVQQRNERIKASSLTEKMPYVPIDCISSKSLFLSNYKDGKEAKTSLIRAYKNDIMFGAMRPYFHKVCISPFDATTRTTAFILKPIQPEDFSFSALQLFQASTIEFATLHSEGSTIPYAKWQNSLEKMQVIIPDEKIRYRFNSLVAPMLESITSKVFENESLANLRDTLLPKLLSGELQISTEVAA